MNIEQYQDKLNSLFKKNNILFAYIFGSSATQKKTSMSDIDIAIYKEPVEDKKTLFQLKLTILSELSYIFEDDRIDLVFLHEAPPLLKYEIITHGKLIYDHSTEKRIEFKRKALNEYFDTQYIRTVNYTCMQMRIKDGGLGDHSRSYFYKTK